MTSRDFDRDGDLDFIASEDGAAGVRVFLNDGAARFTQTQNFSFRGGLGTAAADFNGDGHEDFASNNYISSNQTAIFLNNGDGSFRLGGTIGVGTDTLDLQAMDMNGDGNVDLVSASYADQRIVIYHGAGDGSFRFGASIATLGQSTRGYLSILMTMVEPTW